LPVTTAYEKLRRKRSHLFPWKSRLFTDYFPLPGFASPLWPQSPLKSSDALAGEREGL